MIAGHPDDPDQLFAGGLSNKEMYLSHDGGRTWSQIQISGTLPNVGDPNFLITSDGRLLGIALGEAPNPFSIDISYNSVFGKGVKLKIGAVA